MSLDRAARHTARRDRDYFAFSRTSTTRHRLVADSGRVSMISTRSPIVTVLVASCALSLLVRRITLPYRECLTRSSTATTTVLSILSLTTRPSRVLRCDVRTFSLMPSLSLMPTFLCSSPASLRSSLAGARCDARSCRDLLLAGCHRQAELPLPQDRVDPRDVVPDGAQSPVVVQLPGRHLEPQVEQFLLGLPEPGLQLVVVQLAQLAGLTCHQKSPASRVMIRHFIGSL